MIEIDVQTPIELLNGPRKWQKNAIYVGQTKGDIILPYENLMNNAFFIEIVEGDLYVHSHPDLEFFLIDGKRSSKSKKLKIGQTIGFGSTKLKLVSASENPKLWTDEEMSKKMEQWKNENHPLLPVIEKLNSLKQE